MFNFNRLFILLALVVLALFLVAPVAAQDTPDLATNTPEAVETVAPVATPAPVETPAPPVVVVDQSQIPTWAVVIIIALVLGFVSVAMVGILQAAKGAPPWVQDILLSAAHAGLDSLDTYAKTTETTVDDLEVAELRKKLAQLEESLRTTNEQLTQVITGIRGVG